MSGSRVRRLLVAALAVLYLLHNDLWLWNDGRLMLGLPVGLLYHIGFCLAVALVLMLLVTWGWPPYGEEEPPGGGGGRP